MAAQEQQHLIRLSCVTRLQSPISICTLPLPAMRSPFCFYSPQEEQRRDLSRPERVWRMYSSNLFEDLIILLACSVHFVRRRFWVISTESQITRPNCRRGQYVQSVRAKDQTFKKTSAVQDPRTLELILKPREASTHHRFRHLREGVLKGVLKAF